MTYSEYHGKHNKRNIKYDYAAENKDTRRYDRKRQRFRFAVVIT